MSSTTTMLLEKLCIISFLYKHLKAFGKCTVIIFISINACSSAKQFFLTYLFFQHISKHLSKARYSFRFVDINLLYVWGNKAMHQANNELQILFTLLCNIWGYVLKSLTEIILEPTTYHMLLYLFCSADNSLSWKLVTNSGAVHRRGISFFSSVSI